MPSTPSTYRSYFRFKTSEHPGEQDLNTNLVDKIDTDVNAALTGLETLEGDLSDLQARVDVHADEDGNLIQAPPEFTAFEGTPVYVATTQFYVVDDHTADFTVNRAIQVTLTATSPRSNVKLVSFDAGSNRTTVTLWDSILDSSLSAVALAFIQYSLPKISLASLDFDPATQVELDAHKAGNDHDARYARLTTGGTLQILDANLRIAKAGSPEYELEDLSAAQNLYRRFLLQVSGQGASFFLQRPDTSAYITFLTLDAASQQLILGKPINANNQAISNLPTPSQNGDAARLWEVLARVAKTGDTMTGALSVQMASPTLYLRNPTDGYGDWAIQALGNSNGDLNFYENAGSFASPSWTGRMAIPYNGSPSAGNHITHKTYVDGRYDAVVAYVDSRTPALQFASAILSSGDVTVITDTFQDVGLQATITPVGAHRLRIHVVAVLKNNAAASRWCFLNVQVDNNNVFGGDGVVDAKIETGAEGNCSVSFVTPWAVTAASHTVKVQIKIYTASALGVTLLANANTYASLFVEECSYA